MRRLAAAVCEGACSRARRDDCDPDSRVASGKPSATKREQAPALQIVGIIQSLAAIASTIAPVWSIKSIFQDMF